MDGSNTTYVCSGFKRIIDLKRGYIYYTDFLNNLHIVRCDGEGDKIIAKHFEKLLLINNKSIFFIHNEYVGEDNDDEVGDEYGKSIYVMDLDGNNLHKIAFNVNDACKYDDNNIYYSTKDIFRYIVNNPKGKHDYFPEKISDFVVTIYYCINVHDLSCSRLYVKGAPKFEATAVGCNIFGKKREPIVRRVQYVYPTPSKVRLTYEERASKKTALASLVGSNSSLKNGCANKPKSGVPASNTGCNTQAASNKNKTSTANSGCVGAVSKK